MSCFVEPCILQTYGMDEVPQRQVFENYNWKCDQCYNTTTRRKFWGFSIAIILWWVIEQMLSVRL